MTSACSGTSCDDPPGGFYEIELISGDDALCNIVTPPDSMESGSLESFCNGCDDTYFTLKTGDDPDRRLIPPGEDAWAGGTDINGGRVEVYGSCGGGRFVGTIETWLATECGAVPPTLDECRTSPRCVYSLRMDR